MISCDCRNLWMLLVVYVFFAESPGARPLTTLDYTVSGQLMQVTPAALSVPKGIPGSIGVSIPGDVPSGSFVEGTLRGPSLPARRLVRAIPTHRSTADHALLHRKRAGDADDSGVLVGSEADTGVDRDLDPRGCSVRCLCRGDVARDFISGAVAGGSYQFCVKSVQPKSLIASPCV